jgi:hypothetical protein
MTAYQRRRWIFNNPLPSQRDLPERVNRDNDIIRPSVQRIIREVVPNLAPEVDLNVTELVDLQVDLLTLLKERMLFSISIFSLFYRFIWLSLC